jgi:hypothetical protein
MGMYVRFRKTVRSFEPPILADILPRCGRQTIPPIRWRPSPDESGLTGHSSDTSP